MRDSRGNTTRTGRLDRRTLLHKRYMILETIGQGGMGAVYKARDLRRDRVCAIKEMSLSMIPEAERDQAIQNFKEEAKMLSGLNHPNLPTFSSFFTEGSRHFLVMEYIEGQTLEELLENNNGPFSERRVLGWARQLCDVLEYLHNQPHPIIFRDMKPGNIMLTRNGRIKLIDFGIARFFRQASTQDTQTLGTPGFAPPEQYGKAQTDERSDIYSLAMTLFQLMTNTLSESGFSIKDVRSVNPVISSTVAHALEKAASLEPQNRYENVEAFRRALLGVGMFVFENGDQATTPAEFADLCARYPDEAADYLFSGEAESWLQEIGEPTLARAAQQIRTTFTNPERAVERFLQAVMGPNAHIRPATGSMNGQNGQGVTSTGTASTISQRSNASQISRGWTLRRPVPEPVTDIVVQPRTIDFGDIYPGLSAPIELTITGDRGAFVSGTISPAEPWIVVDQTQFDGMSTRVNVRVDGTRLRGSTHYASEILITPEGSLDEDENIEVKVQVDVLGYTGTITGSTGNTTIHGVPLDDDDDDMITVANSQGTMAGAMMQPAQQRTMAGSAVNAAKYNEYEAKYGKPGANWHPLQTSPKQKLWLQRAITLFAAFMVASLFYTFLAHLQPLAHTSILAPNPWFILVLAGILPFATLGALVTNLGGTKKLSGMINRLCTGMSSALLSLGIAELIWQNLLHVDMPSLQLVFLLLVTALGATVGTNAFVCAEILEGVTWLMVRLRQAAIIAGVVVGAGFGLILTLGFPLSWFTFIGIAVGIAIGLLLIFRVDWIIKQNGP